MSKSKGEKGEDSDGKRNWGKKRVAVPDGPWIRRPLGGLNNSFEKDFCSDAESPIPLGILFVSSVFSIFAILVVLSCLLHFSSSFADGMDEDEEEDNCAFPCPFVAFTAWLLKLKYWLPAMPSPSNVTVSASLASFSYPPKIPNSFTSFILSHNSNWFFTETFVPELVTFSEVLVLFLSLFLFL